MNEPDYFEQFVGEGDDDVVFYTVYGLVYGTGFFTHREYFSLEDAQRALEYWQKRAPDRNVRIVEIHFDRPQRHDYREGGFGPIFPLDRTGEPGL